MHKWGIVLNGYHFSCIFLNTADWSAVSKKWKPFCTFCLDGTLKRLFVFICPTPAGWNIVPEGRCSSRLKPLRLPSCQTSSTATCTRLPMAWTTFTAMVCFSPNSWRGVDWCVPIDFTHFFAFLCLVSPILVKIVAQLALQVLSKDGAFQLSKTARHVSKAVMQPQQQTSDCAPGMSPRSFGFQGDC